MSIVFSTGAKVRGRVSRLMGRGEGRSSVAAGGRRSGTGKQWGEGEAR